MGARPTATLARLQAACRERQAGRRRAAQPGDPPPGRRRRSYTIPHSRMQPWAAATLWDTSDRDDCVPLRASDANTVFPGEKQLHRHRMRAILAEMGWDDPDLADQLDGGLEARTTCPRDTVVSLHHPGTYTHFGAAAK
eukprot:1619439-Prymnesium_polylepis.1